VLDAAAPRIVAVDYGTKRVGLALADPLHLFAQPHGTFRPDEAVDELKRIHAEDGIETVVVGWPLTLEGINRLRNALPDDVRIVKRDERLTSEMAKDTIRRFGVKRRVHPKDDKGRVDAAAAALILQDYLDASGRRSTGGSESG